MKPANRKGHKVIPFIVKLAASILYIINYIVNTHGFNRQGEELYKEEDVIITKGLPTY
jgi:hypothetical protein